MPRRPTPPDVCERIVAAVRTAAAKTVRHADIDSWFTGDRAKARALRLQAARAEHAAWKAERGIAAPRSEITGILLTETAGWAWKGKDRARPKRKHRRGRFDVELGVDGEPEGEQTVFDMGAAR